MSNKFTNSFAVIAIENGIQTLTWKPETANMTDDDFKNINLKFAELSLESNSTILLVDVRDFKHSFEDDLSGWRENEIIPKYNTACVKKFAFVHDASFKGSRMI